MAVLILVFPTQSDAETGLTILNDLAAAYWQDQGLVVEPSSIDGVLEVVPRNAATGQPDFKADRIRTWDTPREAPTGEWWIVSPSTLPAFSSGGWKTAYADAGGPVFAENELPSAWRRGA